jgi:hypothetical protein
MKQEQSTLTDLSCFGSACYNTLRRLQKIKASSSKAIPKGRWVDGTFGIS